MISHQKTSRTCIIPFSNKSNKKKSVSYEVVEVYLKELFAKQFPFVNDFLTFLKDEKKSIGLNKVQWESFYALLTFLGNKNKFLDSYNMSEAWPYLFDEFYLYFCKIKNIKPRIPEQVNDYSEY